MVAVNNTRSRRIVGRDLEHNPVAWEDTDVIHAHLARDIREQFVPTVELDFERGVRQRLKDDPFGADGIDFLLFFRHASPALETLFGSLMLGLETQG